MSERHARVRRDIAHLDRMISTIEAIPSGPIPAQLGSRKRLAREYRKARAWLVAGLAALTKEPSND